MEDGGVISKERAVELVESLLARERPTWAWARLVPNLAVYPVEERSVGWLAYWSSAEYARTPDRRSNLLGGPYLVDREDGSIHFVPGTDWTEDWEELYLWQVKGIRAPDPLAAAVRHLADSAGTAAAMRHLRKRAPRIGVRDAKAYVTIVRDGSEPPRGAGGPHPRARSARPLASGHDRNAGRPGSVAVRRYGRTARRRYAIERLALAGYPRPRLVLAKAPPPSARSRPSSPATPPPSSARDGRPSSPFSSPPRSSAPVRRHHRSDHRRHHRHPDPPAAGSAPYPRTSFGSPGESRDTDSCSLPRHGCGGERRVSASDVNPRLRMSPRMRNAWLLIPGGGWPWLWSGSVRVDRACAGEAR
ncbi:YrhB domain-containing protein [Streptomyces goshikiensis]|uniref:YrhB domain-containing protein n=1 Tax=Streptomyces goshikiensis TaxID=1942 RepID=UPI00371E5BD4